MANTTKTKEYKSKAGGSYTFQTVLPSVWLEAMDDIEDANGKKSRVKLYGMVLDTVIVKPSGMKVDDFADFAELDEVVTEATRFQQGK